MSNKKSNKIKLTIVGCGDAFASGGRFNTCFYFHFSDEHFLVDCGASSLVAMKKQQIPLSKINTIILSHLHGDHFGGIPFFLLDAKHLQKRTEPLTIIGPGETEKKVADLTSLLYPGTTLNTLGFRIKFSTYKSNQKQTIGKLEIQAFPVIHSEGSQPHGIRIGMDKKIFAYSGDTGWTDTLIDIAKDADLFICESNFYDKKIKTHLNYKTLLEHKDQLKCKKIILNHLGEEMLQKISDLEIEAAHDGQEIEF